MKILFVTNAPYPYGSAFSSRARHLIKLMCACGHDVHLIALKDMRMTGKFNMEIKSGTFSFETIQAQQTTLRLLGIGAAKPYIAAIDEYMKSNPVDLIFTNSITYVVPLIHRIAKKNHIPHIIEQCEWYDYSIFKFGRFNPMYQECMRMIDHKVRNLDGVVAISRLFEKHYNDQGMKVIRIPTIVDTRLIQPRIKKDQQNKKINLAFAGSLGKGKENLKPMLEAASKINEKDVRIFLHIYGADEAQVLQNLGGDQALMETIKSFTNIYGRIPQEMVEEKVRAADFSFIMRPHRRSSDAGFPTKLAESMAVGTPVIANNTGDIGMYVKKGVNGFMIESDSVEEIVRTLKLVLAMTNEEIEEMRRQARETAERFFDFNNYVAEFNEFLMCISEKMQ